MPITIRSLVRPHHRHSEATQRAGASPDAEVYVIGKGVTRADFIRALRPSDVVEIEWVFLLAELRSKATPKPVSDFFDALAKIERKAVVVEWGSGKRLRSDRKQDRDAMVARAVDMIRNSGRSLAATKGGRPGFKFSPEELIKMKGEWVSRENRTNDERVAAITLALGRPSPGPSKLRQMFGSPLGNRAR